MSNNNNNTIQDPVNLAAFTELDKYLIPDIVNIIKEYSELPSHVYIGAFVSGHRHCLLQIEKFHYCTYPLRDDYKKLFPSLIDHSCGSKFNTGIYISDLEPLTYLEYKSRKQEVLENNIYMLDEERGHFEDYKSNLEDCIVRIKQIKRNIKQLKELKYNNPYKRVKTM